MKAELVVVMPEGMSADPRMMAALKAQARDMQRQLSGQTAMARRSARDRALMRSTCAGKLLRKVDVPLGRCGEWSVERFEVGEENARVFNMREALHGHRFIEPGIYRSLVHRPEGQTGELWMTDTPAECADHAECVVQAARFGGHVLIFGLGLGVVTQAMCDMPNVEHVTVVELEQGVIDLVGPFWKNRYGDKLSIVCADAFAWEPPRGQRFGVVWCDIWLHLSAGNLSEQARLNRRYARRSQWVGSWAQDVNRLMAREEKRQAAQFRKLFPKAAAEMEAAAAQARSAERGAKPR